jgi:hypothetical protein
MNQQPMPTTYANNPSATALPMDGTWLDYTKGLNFTSGQVLEAEGIAWRTLERHLDHVDDPFGIEMEDGPYLVGVGWRFPRASIVRYHRWCRGKAVTRRRAGQARAAAATARKQAAQARATAPTAPENDRG